MTSNSGTDGHNKFYSYDENFMPHQNYGAFNTLELGVELLVKRVSMNTMKHLSENEMSKKDEQLEKSLELAFIDANINDIQPLVSNLQALVNNESGEKILELNLPSITSTLNTTNDSNLKRVCRQVLAFCYCSLGKSEELIDTCNKLLLEDFTTSNLIITSLLFFDLGNKINSIQLLKDSFIIISDVNLIFPSEAERLMVAIGDRLLLMITSDYEDECEETLFAQYVARRLSTCNTASPVVYGDGTTHAFFNRAHRLSSISETMLSNFDPLEREERYVVLCNAIHNFNSVLQLVLKKQQKVEFQISYPITTTKSDVFSINAYNNTLSSLFLEYLHPDIPIAKAIKNYHTQFASLLTLVFEKNVKIIQAELEKEKQSLDLNINNSKRLEKIEQMLNLTKSQKEKEYLCLFKEICNKHNYPHISDVQRYSMFHLSLDGPFVPTTEDPYEQYDQSDDEMENL